MDWYSIGLAAICGALAGVVSGKIVPKKTNNIIHWFTFAVLFTVLLTLSKLYIRPMIG